MPDKIKYTPNLIPYSDAIGFFANESDLLDALKMGRVLSLGRIQHHVDLPDVLSSLTPIFHETWIFSPFDGKELSCVGTDDNGCEDPYFIRDIYIDKTSIDSMRRVLKNTRGREPKYNWDSFWQAVAYHVYAADAIDEPIPTSLRDWARNARTIYSYLWPNGAAPAETTIEDKLRPLFDAINTSSTKPIEESAELFKRKSGGK